MPRRAHAALVALAAALAPEVAHAQPPVPTGQAELAGTSRVKLFYDPDDADDLYVNRRGADRLPTLRTYGHTTVCDPLNPGQGNRPATAGTNAFADPVTGRLAEDPPYYDPEGPFSPLSPEAPEFDYVTWNPAWISERLGDARGLAGWECAGGLDEVSRGSRIRIDGRNASEKVWLRHWYEPTHLDKDLNADGCLTDRRGARLRDDDPNAPDGPDGSPDAPRNPMATNIDEWYPAIMTEMTYLLTENDLPVASPDPDELDDSAPRPACGSAGRTRMVFPMGVDEAATDPMGPAVGYGLTSLDADFDGRMDMVNVASEASLAASLDLVLDFDGDGTLDSISGDGLALSCDELVVMHTDAITLARGDKLQFLDHYVTVRTVSDNSAVLQVWYTGDLVPRSAGKTATLGVGAAAFAGDTGPLQVVASGGGNLGSVPIGPWFVALQEVDVRDGTVTLIVGRGLGAPCAPMELAANVPNLSPGAPWFLKRFYVDGHEYNVVAIMSCDRDSLQYITLRAPLPKVPVAIEQHSVRLRGYLPGESLALPPPFNHEHTVLGDIVRFDGFDPCPIIPINLVDLLDRPQILYMGGPIGPVPPVLGDGDGLIYEGRFPETPVGPYDLGTNYLEGHWFYTAEDVEPSFIGELREKYGAIRTDVLCSVDPEVPDSFFYNEQIFTQPWHYTEFVMPNSRLDGPGDDGACDPDSYYVTSGFINPTANWRRWTMPDGPVPETLPPLPPDLSIDATGYDPANLTHGAPRRASFEYDPDIVDPVYIEPDAIRLYGGLPRCEDDSCFEALSRPELLAGAGDLMAATDVAGYPVEVLPYTDPFAPFNPQHPDAPRADSLTFNPAYMDEFRHFGEPLLPLYRQLSNNGMNVREKVYHRVWYEPGYVTKIRNADDCDSDLAFPAVVQEFTYLMMDTTDNPVAVPPASSRIAFPIGTGPTELPRPNRGGTLPAGGGFGHGLTTFDADFDGVPNAVTLHTEATLASLVDQVWQSNRPRPIGLPVTPLAGPVLDLDGDGIVDDLDADCTSLNGNELAVFTVESLTLERGESAMLLDYLVTLENITPGQSTDVRFWFTGGTVASARPETVRGIHTLAIGDAAIIDRFQDRVTVVSPGETNPGTDGGWFVFVEDVAADAERVTLTIGRALGAAGSAIDDGAGNHDLFPGDPWYLKRFYVDGHEYNVVALMTRTAPGGDPLDPALCNEALAFITIRTPVPKGDFFNPQDTLFQQGYFLDGLPPTMSVMPPFNVRHTIAEDIARIDPDSFADPDHFGPCIGALAPAEALVETIVAETHEPRFGVELRETYNLPVGIRTGAEQGPTTLGSDDAAIDGPAAPMTVVLQPDARSRFGWETHQSQITPWTYTAIAVPSGQLYLATLNWRSPVNDLAFYGCTRQHPGPFDEDDPPVLDQQDILEASLCWRADLIPPPPSQRFPPFIGLPADDGWEARIQPGAPPTPTPAPTATVPPAPTPTPPAAGAFQVAMTEEFRAQVTWREDTAGSDGYLVEARAGEGPFVPVANVPAGAAFDASADSAARIESTYAWTSGQLVSGTTYGFKVTPLRDGAGSPLAPPATLAASPLPNEETACVVGTVALQGRALAGGVVILIDGMPAGTTDDEGAFELCGALPGVRDVVTLRRGYLPAGARVLFEPDGLVTLPATDVPGGDTNGDRRVDLFDLVRVGASYDTSPPAHPDADLNEDGAVNLFDLVMVSGNYDRAGIVPWWPDAPLPTDLEGRATAPDAAAEAPVR